MLVQLEKYLGAYLPARVPSFFILKPILYEISGILVVCFSLHESDTCVFAPRSMCAAFLALVESDCMHPVFVRATFADIAMPALHAHTHALINSLPLVRILSSFF